MRLTLIYISLVFVCALPIFSSQAQVKDIIYEIPDYATDEIIEYLGKKDKEFNPFILLSLKADTCQVLICNLEYVSDNLKLIIGSSNRAIKLPTQAVPLILDEDLFFYEKFWGEEISEFGGKGMTRTTFMLEGRLIRFTIDNWGRGKVFYSEYFTP